MSAVEISEQTAAELINSPSRPTAPLRTESFRDSRPDIVGPDEPPAPFPVIMRGAVQKGFGRGGRDLGCLTGVFGNLLVRWFVLTGTISQSTRRVTGPHDDCGKAWDLFRICEGAFS